MVNNFFVYHRHGLSLQPEKPWEDPNRPPVWKRRQGAWYGQYSGDPNIPIEKQVRMRWLFRDRGGGSNRAKSEIANRGAKAVRRFLRGRGCDVNLLQVLGWGGNGVASLFEVGPGSGVARKKVVVKSMLRSGHGNDMDAERRMTLNLKRARHIVQILSWRLELMANIDPPNQVPGATNGWALIDGNKELLTLEYMKNGDLWGFIKKIAAAGERTPNKILWKIFFCLVRACISMKVPPRLRTGANGEPFWDNSVGPDLVEGVPSAADPTRKHTLDVVHFDLDTKNILIGDFDNNEHQTAPILKVSDFGLAKTNTDAIFSEPIRAWLRRKAGKVQYLLPEQFHKEWEYIDILPGLEQTQPTVAGQYGSWSNVYAIALSMQLLISQAGPPYPPVALGPLNHPDGNNLFEVPPVFVDVRQNRVRPFYTHGYQLEIETDVDPQLRHLLMRCLADKPTDRPMLQELEEWIWSKEALPGWNDPNDGTREWCDRIFRDAPDAPSSAAEAHPSLATTPPQAASPPPVISWDGKDSPGSRDTSSSSDASGGGGVPL
ncbi:Myoblast growth factor receptor egl-15 [Cytospora mali]|uniref:Myoblast growth factor receptor egl-15 n=1 Tax=Cytospora mali TaxID=578113 RepID=A0A194VA77_CYTMA|nr:Myoblast growth factor receptor egl-15 [Valsa mali var. pyri (nom. inval.)]